MITSDGWVSWAMRLPSHPAKQYLEPNRGIGIACHSVVGELHTGQVPARFLSDQREASDPNRFTAYAAASTMFLLYKDGTLGQCYPVNVSTWTSGGREANTNYMAVELAGGAAPNYGEPMTDGQVESFVRLVRDLEAFRGISYVPGVNILQHKDLAQKYGYSPTACASDRYQRAWDILASPKQVEESVTPEQVDALVAPLRAAIAELKQAVADGQAELAKLNAAVMDREYLREIAAGPIAGVRDAVQRLDGEGK